MADEKVSDCIDPEICELQHRELDRRLTKVETSFSSNIERMYAKIETQTLYWAEKAADNAKRPGWAQLTIITLLSSLCVGMTVASVYRK